ncbi:hypothetical protein WH50_12605 [Pokkaliibacter plantistimulans]|uniref:DUF2889 domain-containing protein n=1 Tax=Pokkaliibacter plantistimulans TaxID=1635171 RepID=A0ABX5LWG4_9GAMM|nr:DUF2889 domain-containing protein [Pokkaliibacter plantistimulans]PXF30954.1 hypothetical protein WH50_12605 [Pokkaliibacter plantistimulans]
MTTNNKGATGKHHADDHSGTRASLHRLIDLRNINHNETTAWLEDDFHHFGVSVHHQDGIVTDVQATAVRVPWTTCSGATEKLRELIGQPLVSRATDVGKYLKRRYQCVHLFDLAGLASAFSHLPTVHRRYQAIVSDRPRPGYAKLREVTDLGQGRAQLLMDGQCIMDWQIDGEWITSPATAAGYSTEQGFRQWTETLPIDEAEHAFILRRAIIVATGRQFDLDSYQTLADMRLSEDCFSLQPEHREEATRCQGSTRDFAAAPETLLAHLRHPSRHK